MRKPRESGQVHSPERIRAAIREGGDPGVSGMEDDWVASYMPFVIRTVSRLTGRYVDTRNSEELGVALEAFDEAIRRFEPGRGSFEGFASMLIRHRIIDFWKKEKDRTRTVPLEEGDLEVLHQDTDLEHQELLKEEIRLYEGMLSAYGIRFSRLAEESPKHRDTRDNLLKIAREVAARPEWGHWVKEKKRLPRREMKKQLGVTDRLMTLNRQYLLAAILLLDSDLELIRDLVFEGKEETGDAL